MAKVGYLSHQNKMSSMRLVGSRFSRFGPTNHRAVGGGCKALRQSGGWRFVPELRFHASRGMLPALARERILRAETCSGTRNKPRFHGPIVRFYAAIAGDGQEPEAWIDPGTSGRSRPTGKGLDPDSGRWDRKPRLAAKDSHCWNSGKRC